MSRTQRLAELEQSVCDAEMCVTKQTQHVHALAMRGEDTKNAVEVLKSLEQTIALIRVRRRALLSSW